MTRTKLAALAACLIASSASAQEDLCLATANCDYEIRARLLGTPVWLFEITRAQRTISGVMRFEQRGYKLIGHFDTGLKCDSEIKFVEGGFTLETCGDAFYGRKFVQVDDAYQVIYGTYIYTIRPPR
jgi:hypothetical protein